MKKCFALLLLFLGLVCTASAQVVRVNAGGPAYTDPLGQVWAADTGFSNGGGVANSQTVTGTTTPVLYQTAHWCSEAGSAASTYTTFTATVPNGNYLVTLKFDENNRTAAGQRLFNIAINSTTVATNFDIFALAGGQFKALDRTYTVNVTTGKVVILFTPVVFNPRVGAIQIVPVPAPVITYTYPMTNAMQQVSALPSQLTVPLAGIGAMIAYDLPPKDATGVVNATRQDNAVIGAVSEAINDGLLPHPYCDSNNGCYQLSDYNSYALAWAHMNNQYSDVRPKQTLITWIQFFLTQDRYTDGTVNWTGCTATIKCVDGDITSLISLGLDPTAGGWMLSGTVTSAQLTSFAHDLARTVDYYNTH